MFAGAEMSRPGGRAASPNQRLPQTQNEKQSSGESKTFLATQGVNTSGYNCSLYRSHCSFTHECIGHFPSGGAANSKTLSISQHDFDRISCYGR
jgi:hypothetical protein